jgi:hypothetical protein
MDIMLSDNMLSDNIFFSDNRGDELGSWAGPGWASQ